MTQSAVRGGGLLGLPMYKPVNAVPSEVSVSRPMGLSMQQKLTHVSDFIAHSTVENSSA
jgi:hypothetical protein